MRVTLWVYFDDPFWVGVIRREERGRASAARHVFGPEPSDGEVLDWLLDAYGTLPFSPAIDAEPEALLASNPKRRQRQAASVVATGIGTRAQQALSIGREMQKQERKAETKAEREREDARKFALRQEKRKAKHRGR